MTAVALNVAADLATLTLSAGGKPPTLDHDLLDGLDAAIEAIEKSPQVRAVILRGDTDKYFAVGANINALKTLDESTMARWVEHGHAVFNRLERLVVPTLARVSGWCVGGGLELAMACDLIIASESAKFGQPEAKLGFITGWGGAARLRDRVGAGRARLLLLTGRTIDAAEALRIGLADALHETGRDAEALPYCQKAVAVAPENGELWATLGHVHTELGHHDDALAAYQKALELGVATAANLHLAASSEAFPFAIDTHYPLQLDDVLVERLDMATGIVDVPAGPGLGVAVDAAALERLAQLPVREAVFYDDIEGQAPRVGQIL